jgi:hypothetical protein
MYQLLLKTDQHVLLLLQQHDLFVHPALELFFQTVVLLEGLPISLTVGVYPEEEIEVRLGLGECE